MRTIDRRATRVGGALALATLASMTLLSCWTPVFDPAISASARLEKKLEKVVSFRPTWMDEDSFDDGYFLPHRALAPTDGYWVKANTDGLGVRYVYKAVSGDTILCQSQGGIYNALGAAASVSALTDASAAGVSPAMGRGLLLAISADASGVRAQGLDASYGLSVSSTATVSGATNPRMVGASRAPLNATQDVLTISHYSTQDFQVFFGFATIDNAAAFASPTINVGKPNVDPDLNIRSGAFVAYNAAGYYYLSGRLSSNGSLRTERWLGLTDSSPTVLSGVDRQLTDLLSDGRLLARGELSTIAYDADGKELFEIPTGSLRFVHEVYDSAAGVWYSYFSRSALARTTDNSEGGDLMIDVFRIPTSNLKSLAN